VKWIRERHAVLDRFQQSDGYAVPSSQIAPEFIEQTRPASWSLRLLGEEGITEFGTAPDFYKSHLTGQQLKALFLETAAVYDVEPVPQ